MVFHICWLTFFCWSTAIAGDIVVANIITSVVDAPAVAGVSTAVGVPDVAGFPRCWLVPVQLSLFCWHYCCCGISTIAGVPALAGVPTESQMLLSKLLMMTFASYPLVLYLNNGKYPEYLSVYIIYIPEVLTQKDQSSTVVNDNSSSFAAKHKQQVY